MVEVKKEVAKTTTAIMQEEFENKKKVVKELVVGAIKENFNIKAGYTEKDIISKQQNATMFLQMLFAAKDTAKRPAIFTVSKESILECVLTYLNGDYDLFKNQAYLFPFGSELKFMVSKDGYVSLAKRLNPNIEDFYYDIVYKNDEFLFEKNMGKTTITKHVQKLSNITADVNDVVCAYATCVFKDGTHIADIMTKQEIMNSLATAQKQFNDAHKKNPKIMLSKFPLRRLAKSRIFQSNPELGKIIVDEEYKDHQADEYKHVDTVSNISENSFDNFDNSENFDNVEEIIVENLVVVDEKDDFDNYDNANYDVDALVDLIDNEEGVVDSSNDNVIHVPYGEYMSNYKGNTKWKFVNYDKQTRLAKLERNGD